MHVRSWLTGLCAAAATAFVSGCMPMHVNSYVERGVNVSQFRTFDFAPADAASTGDPRLDNNPFFQDHVRGAVARAMAAKGFERSTSGGADLFVHFHASVTQQIDVAGIDQEHGYCRAGDCRPFVYDAGTLVIDLVEGRDNRLVWRGWAESSLDAVVDNQTWMEQKIDEAVTRILKRLPSRL
jgi:Domain of unknown function (DUF4136)